ncbi:MAG: hypothetical protein OQJ97_12260 [Rhodospirillales bacterium]|nr:hypothetical protein [Rhodospirillales bacterium]
MPFVTRNEAGKIVAVYDVLTEGALEEVPSEDKELRAFLGIEDAEWMQADMELARVTEDLIDILIEKGIIMFTDLPDAAQHKLLKRQGLRSRLDYVSQLFTIGDDEDGFF